MNFEHTFIMVKPDGVQRRLVGSVISKFENKGLKLASMKFIKASEQMIREMYSDECDQPYFPLLLNIMTNGPIVAMIWIGENAVGVGRILISEEITALSKPGTIRGDLCIHVGRNIVHGADSKDEAKKDIAIWFPEFNFNSEI